MKDITVPGVSLTTVKCDYSEALYPKRLKELEKENSKLKRLVAELSLEKPVVRQNSSRL